MKLPFDQIAVVDYETYYDDEISLSNMSQTEYIQHPDFELQTAAIKIHGGKKRPVVRFGIEEIGNELASIDWSRTAFLGHHTHFDGLISTHHLGIYPAFWMCSMVMARAVLGVDESVSLHAVSQRIGRKGKVNKQALVQVKGKRLADFTKEDRRFLALYNGDDVEDTIAIHDFFRPFFPDSAMRLTDRTLRMYAEPVFELDEDMLRTLYEEEKARRAGIVNRLAAHFEPLVDEIEAAQEARYSAYEAKGKTYKKPRETRLEILFKELRSASKFAGHLEEAGVEPPTKISMRNGNETYAFAKDDLEFKELLEHPEEHVRDLVEGRFTVASNIVESRSGTLLKRCGYPTPIYLAPYAARTHRWGGGDKSNWQNPPKRGPGVKIRNALRAPKGTHMIIADASQIECRMNAWKCGQEDKLQWFRDYDAGLREDIYCFAGSGIFGYEVFKETHPDERMLGKIYELAGGYQAGYRKMNYTLRSGKYAKPIFEDLAKTERDLMAWRRKNNMLVEGWDKHDLNTKLAFQGGREIEDGPLIFEGVTGGGRIHGPDNMFLFYPNVHINDRGDLCYFGRNGVVKIYGGLITENIIQYLAFCVIAEHMDIIERDMDDAGIPIRIGMTTHDEMGIVVRDKEVDIVMPHVKKVMSTPSVWCPTLPLNADVHASRFYDKT